jgi:hypothetical protein
MTPVSQTDSSIWQGWSSTSAGAATLSGSGRGGSAGGYTAAALPPTSSGTGATANGSPAQVPGPPASTLVGGVVGGVAGLAVVALVALFLLKWKKRHDSGLRLLNDGNRSQSFSAGDRAGPGGPSGSSVAERLLPFAVPASLAALTGQKAVRGPPSEASDSLGRSFYRVSGRKLTSVLESGGDGYGEPRNPHESMQSATSYYRDSHGWYGDPANLPRLQLGSPIPRPDDGFPVMRAGPARTPVTEEGPPHYPRPLTPNAPAIDPTRRLYAAQDGSDNVSARFSEGL